MKVQHVRGIGLVEIMVTVVVLGIIAAVAAPSFTDMLNRRRVEAVANSITTDLAFMRTEQSAHPSEIDLQVNSDPTGKQMSCYAIYVPNSQFTCDCTNVAKVCSPKFGSSTLDPLIRAEQTPASTKVSYAAFSAGAVLPAGKFFKYDTARLIPSPADMYFDICGSPKSSTRPILRVEFNDAGRARICSPNSSMGGYGSCTAPVAAPQCP